MVLVYVIFVIMVEYMISYRENILPSEQQLSHSLLCSIYQPTDIYLTQLLIFIHHIYVFIH
jgi:hypothetical protein